MKLEAAAEPKQAESVMILFRVIQAMPAAGRDKSWVRCAFGVRICSASQMKNPTAEIIFRPSDPAARDAGKIVALCGHAARNAAEDMEDDARCLPNSQSEIRTVTHGAPLPEISEDFRFWKDR